MVRNHRELVLVLVLRTSVVLVPVMDLVLVYGFVAGSLLGNGLEEKMGASRSAGLPFFIFSTLSEAYCFNSLSFSSSSSSSPGV